MCCAAIRAFNRMKTKFFQRYLRRDQSNREFMKKKIKCFNSIESSGCGHDKWIEQRCNSLKRVCICQNTQMFYMRQPQDV